MSTVVKDLGAVSAYAYAVEKGYTGTEAEFAELMADYAEVGQRAEDAADSALESKTAAQTAATTATNKASEATTAATTATNKAAEAQADADAAALDASQALSAASTATTKATEATTAAATATSAATTATTAKDDAVSAKTAAQTAQTGAETAAASVQSSAAQIATNTDDIAQLKSELSGSTYNLLDISKLTSANASMEEIDGVVSNTKTDTRTYLQFCVQLFNGSSYVGTVYDASETAREKIITFTSPGNADKLRIKHNGSTLDLYIDLTVQISSGTVYTLSLDITGANPTATGGFSFDKVQLNEGSAACPYVPHITAVDYISREKIENLENNTEFIFDEAYASRYLLTAKDYLTLNGKYIGATGTEADSANHIASDYILVHKADVITYTLRGSNNSVSVGYFYNISKTPTERIALATAYNQDVSGAYTAPDNGYVRICTRVDHESPEFQIGGGGKLLGIRALIADCIANSTDYPSYWDSAVEAAISDYYVKSAIVADHGVSFAYVTDTHWTFNAQNSSKLISHIFKKTNLNMAVHGGDFVRYGAEDIYGFMQYMDKSIKFLPVIGNHEYDTSVGITTSQDYAYAFKQSENLFTHRQGFSYCYDDNAQNVRFISLDYNDADCIALLETWATELATDWNIVVLSHMYWGTASRGNNPEVTTIGTQIASKIDALEGTINAHFVLFLVGHVHRDLNTTTSKGIPIVATNCDAYTDSQSYDWGGYKMYADDTTSQCIDLVNIDTANKKIYMTRLGVGSDREFSY